MKETEVLEQAAIVIRDCLVTRPGVYWLVVESKKMKVQHCAQVLPAALKICCLSTHEIRSGIQSSKWTKIDGLLRRCVREGLL